jgi:hypothetical protein
MLRDLIALSRLASINREISDLKTWVARIWAHQILFSPVCLPAFLFIASVVFAIITKDMVTRGTFAICAILSLAFYCAQGPILGCIVIVFLTLVLDQFTWQFSTLTHELGFYFYENWWKLLSHEGRRELDFLKFNSVEILMLATAIGLVLQLRRKGARVSLTPESLLALGFLTAVTVMFFWGIWSGGELKPALWQVRPYFHLVAMCLLLSQAIRNEQDLRLVSWTLIVAVTIKASQVVWIFWVMADGRFDGWREIVGHEDSVFFVAGLSLLATLWLYDNRPLHRILVVCLSGILFVGLVLNLRRAGYLALGLTVLLTPLVVHQRRKTAFAYLFYLAAATTLYLVVFWNSTSILGIPAQKVQSIFVARSGTADYNSNTYRVGENSNLWYTIQRNPLGTGFGKPFEMHFPLADISDNFPNWQYHPHNMFLGLLMSLGPINFTIYLTFICGVMTTSNFAVKQSSSGFTKAVAASAFLAVAAGFFVSAVDAFIHVPRGAIFLGIVIGMISAISAMQGRILGPTRTPVGDPDTRMWDER